MRFSVVRLPLNLPVTHRQSDGLDIKKWEINQAAGRYIRSHEEVQRISIRNRLHDFKQQNGAELAAALAPELMEIKNQPAMIKNRALDRLC